MKSLAVVSLFLGLVVTEPVLLSHRKQYIARQNARSMIGAADPQKSSEQFNLVFDSTNRIVGGEVADEDHYLHLVSVGRSSHSCSASIISDTWIVTAAHCVDGVSSGSLRIRYYSMKNLTDVPVTRIVKHPSYDSSTIDYDIALIQVGTPIILDPNSAETIQLVEQGNDPKEGEIVTVAGWLSSIPTDMRKMVIISREACENALIGSRCIVTDRMICAVEEGNNSFMDAGGSVVVSGGKLAGIIGPNLGCRQSTYPRIFTRVGLFRDWIKVISDV